MKKQLVAVVMSAVMAYGAIGAVALATVRTTGQALAICAIYKEGDPEWYLFFCYLDRPEAASRAPQDQR